jgi:hypothetical protein
MPVTRKPKEEAAPHTPEPEDPEFQKYLRKGGSSAHAEAETRPEPKDVRQTLIIPGILCREVDQLREKLRPLKKSRHQWLIEAIMEKVKRDQKADAE